ncbi:MAG: fumarylacetoacetase [Bacteroidota bacterium]
MIRANDPSLKSWVTVSADSEFPIQNLPFGIVQLPGKPPRVASAIGDFVIDLYRLWELGLLTGLDLNRECLENRCLNDFINLGRSTTRAVRDRLSELLDAEVTRWNSREWRDQFLHPKTEVELLLPVKVTDYTDFYSSIEHATNVGTMFRGPENALMPNWRHLPVGYHGRASSIVVSGTPIRRPYGQQKPAEPGGAPAYGPSRLMDFELEMAFIVGRSTQMGDRVRVDEAEDYIFGLALFNDWSARDIQAWEYVPLGPFLGKNFGSTLSPWIVSLDALEPFRVVGPEQDPAVLPYLQSNGAKNYDLHLEVAIAPEGGEAFTVCRSNFKYMYWNMCQQLAHQTVNGCNITVGDLYASGTISGPTPDAYGSMLEISWRGSRPIQLPDGSERKFIADGDTVILRGYGERDGIRIGFGDAVGKILPAHEQG